MGGTQAIALAGQEAGQLQRGTQHVVDARLPSRALGAQGGQHIRIQRQLDGLSGLRRDCQASGPDQPAGGASPSNSSAIGSVSPTLSSTIASLPEKSINSKLPRSLRR